LLQKALICFRTEVSIYDLTKVVFPVFCKFEGLAQQNLVTVQFKKNYLSDYRINFANGSGQCLNYRTYIFRLLAVLSNTFQSIIRIIINYWQPTVLLIPGFTQIYMSIVSFN